MATIFTRVIRGEIPSHAVYEDDHAFAFLDINPRQPGHTLVVPKAEVDYLFDLDPEEYTALWSATNTVATALKRTTGCARVVVVVLGYEVPHAHIHLIPSNDLGDLPFPPAVNQTAEQFADMAQGIRDSLTGGRYGADTALLVVDVQNDF
ncbi:HIT family protein, partial [bacterium]|nr:HIT family protein [bacterium]